MAALRAVAFGLAPAAIFFVLPWLFNWQPVLLDVIPLSDEMLKNNTESAADALVSLTGTMTSLATAMLVGAVYLYRETAASRARTILVGSCILAGVTSIVAGGRFLMSLGEQLATIKLDLTTIGPRLDAQGTMLVVQISLLLALAGFDLDRLGSGRKDKAL